MGQTVPYDRDVFALPDVKDASRISREIVKRMGLKGASLEAEVAVYKLVLALASSAPSELERLRELRGEGLTYHVLYLAERYLEPEERDALIESLGVRRED